MDPGNESGNAVCVGQSCHMQTVVETWFCTCAGQVQPLRISGARFQVVWKTLVSSIIDKDPPIGLSIVSAGVVGQWQDSIVELLVDPGTFSCSMEPERGRERREEKRTRKEREKRTCQSSHHGTNGNGIPHPLFITCMYNAVSKASNGEGTEGNRQDLQVDIEHIYGGYMCSSVMCFSTDFSERL